MNLPKLGSSLTKAHHDLLTAFAKSCRSSILQMTTNAESGHPGGSLSCIDYLSLLYSFIISQTGEKIVISNGHISPAVYAVLAELGYIPKKEVLEGFRKSGFPYEGHVARQVRGVWYSTGPLATGISAAAGFALAEKLKLVGSGPGLITPQKVFGIIGDGESEEGQVYEMMNFAAKYKLDNFIVFMDYNRVQLSNSLANIMPLNPKKLFAAAGWNVIVVDGHNYKAMWQALASAYATKGKPTLLLGNTIMGKGVPFMEREGKKHHATWHGKAAKQEDIAPALEQLILSDKESLLLAAFKKQIKWKPQKPEFTKTGVLNKKVKIGKPIVYKADELMDCRTAYGKALLDLAKKNKNIVALTADLAESVKTNYVQEEIPERHIECGIAEQHMVSCSGGLSLNGFIPFCSTFGAFMTSRAKDQARVNDVNHTNVKMVATHCGLSVGEDGPTHQAIDDSGSMLGLFNTEQMEPSDPNHCDRMIRYAASHTGNMYVRMGRHKIPVLTKQNGDIFFDANYEYVYGKCEVLRAGNDITIAAMGATVIEALRAHESLKARGISAEIIIVSSIKKFDDTLATSIKKTKRVVTVEDHNTLSGLGGQLARHLASLNIHPESYTMIGVEQYQLSGTAKDLYRAASIDATAIEKHVIDVIKK